MSQLYIVRHGNTFDAGQTPTRVGARTDLDLSSSGKAQATALAKDFEDINFDAAICSPLCRTRQTASIILQPHKPAPPLLILPFLTEIDYGVDENKPEADVIARLGQAALDAWDADAIPPDGWHVDPKALIQDWKDVIARAASLPANANILIVTSNGIARFLLDAVDTLPPESARKLRTGAYGQISVTPDGASALISWNVRPAKT